MSSPIKTNQIQAAMNHRDLSETGRYAPRSNHEVNVEEVIDVDDDHHYASGFANKTMNSNTNINNSNDEVDDNDVVFHQGLLRSSSRHEHHFDEVIEVDDDHVVSHQNQRSSSYNDQTDKVLADEVIVADDDDRRNTDKDNEVKFFPIFSKPGGPASSQYR